MTVSELLPIVAIVGFAIYPFALTALTALVVSRTGRHKFARFFAAVAAIVGCLPPVSLFARLFTGGDMQHGGPLLGAIILGSAVFVFCTASTGALIGAIVDAIAPSPKPASRNNGAAESRQDHNNPYSTPISY